MSVFCLIFFTPLNRLLLETACSIVDLKYAGMDAHQLGLGPPFVQKCLEWNRSSPRESPTGTSLPSHCLE